MSLFYKELRDMIRVTNVLRCLSVLLYMMYQNIDFGTVKGFSTSYDLGEPKSAMTTNYALQFADGTGSSSFSGYSLVNTGQWKLENNDPIIL